MDKIVHVTNHLCPDFPGLIAEKQPDLVILDYKLGGKEVIEICTRLKRVFANTYQKSVTISKYTGIHQLLNIPGMTSVIGSSAE